MGVWKNGTDYLKAPMPYKLDYCGIYKIVNTVTNECYVGQSQHVKKRLREHFRLLRSQKHANSRLQRAFNKYGPEAFYGDVEVVCDTADDLDALEEAFIRGDAYFPSPAVYNIAAFAKAPMRGKTHPESVRERIRLGRRAATFDYKSDSYRANLSAAQRARTLADPKFVARLKYILDNAHLSYAERGRAVSLDTSSVRKQALRYASLKGTL